MIISHTGNWKQRHSRAIDVIFLARRNKKINPNLKQKPGVSRTFINTKALCTRFLMLVFWGLACFRSLFRLACYE